MSTNDDNRYSEDLAHLIYLSLQFGWRGETDLKRPELQRLESRGWIAEGEENGEYDITDDGRELIDARLARQPEVSEEDVQTACRAYDNASSVHDDCCSGLAMRAALQSVRLPVGVVSWPQKMLNRADTSEVYGSGYAAALRDAAAYLSSRHAPTKD
ncbi:MAG TPA: hypothetical protein VFQ32_09110 [Ktedonobacterales bacterium]|nr:hypothetical protein [Ktedonobacterales bacterium]